jgi:hypothetical protein
VKDSGTTGHHQRQPAASPGFRDRDCLNTEPQDHHRKPTFSQITKKKLCQENDPK